MLYIYIYSIYIIYIGGAISFARPFQQVLDHIDTKGKMERNCSIETRFLTELNCFTYYSTEIMITGQSI